MLNLDIQLHPSQRILFCMDFSVNSQLAFKYAIDAAQRFPGCTLHLLHVIPEVEAQFWKTYIYEIDGIDDKAKQDINDKITSDYISRIPCEIKSQIEVRMGKDYQVILEYAKEIDCDLIIIGRQGQSNFKKVLFGNVTEKVTRHAKCPILVIPLIYETKQKTLPDKTS